MPGKYRRNSPGTVGKVFKVTAVIITTPLSSGAGLLNFPQAYMEAGGVHIAIAIQVVLLIFILGAFVILARCADRYQAPTYQVINSSSPAHKTLI